MANIIIHKPDSYGKTRSEQEENMRKDWGYTMTDTQLDRLKFIEKRKKGIDGSAKNFITGIEIDEFDRMDKVDRRDERGHIFSAAFSRQGRENYDKIDWSPKVEACG